MKYYIISGEASGDLHASNLVKAIRLNDSTAQFRGWGGDLMRSAGVDVVKHYEELAFMGFLEVIANLRTILRNINVCKEDILAYQPDALILIDYPGFNLRIAKFAKLQGLKVYYYISPQVWAWKQSRVHDIKRDVDKMLVILPFEKIFYEKFAMDVDFVGHPLLDAIAERKSTNPQLSSDLQQIINKGKPIIALLPGSRRQEISVMLPLMLSVIPEFSRFSFVVAAAPSIEQSFYTGICGSTDVSVIEGKTYELLENAHAALVTSGTATLETALYRVPEVVCYKGNMISYQIAKRLIKVDYISLVNLVLGRESIKELIQAELNTTNLIKELKKVASDDDVRKRILNDYDELITLLGNEGASARAAEVIIHDLQQNITNSNK